MNGAESQQLARIDEKLSNVEKDIGEIKVTVKCIDSREQAFEREAVSQYATLAESMKNAHHRINENKSDIELLTEKIDDLRKLMRPLVSTNKIVVWAGGLLGGSIFLLIWMIIIGQVSLNFK